MPEAGDTQYEAEFGKSWPDQLGQNGMVALR